MEKAKMQRLQCSEFAEIALFPVETLRVTFNE